MKRFRFGMKTLIVGYLVVGFSAAWIGRHYQLYKYEVAEIDKLLVEGSIESNSPQAAGSVTVVKHGGELELARLLKR